MHTAWPDGGGKAKGRKNEKEAEKGQAATRGARRETARKRGRGGARGERVRERKRGKEMRALEEEVAARPPDSPPMVEGRKGIGWGAVGGESEVATHNNRQRPNGRAPRATGQEKMKKRERKSTSL